LYCGEQTFARPGSLANAAAESYDPCVVDLDPSLASKVTPLCVEPPARLSLHPTRPRPAPPPGPWLVAGLGRAGTAAVAALESLGGASAVSAWDAASTPPVCAAARALQQRGIRVTLGGDGLQALARDVACVVKSPGVRHDIPLLRVAHNRGLPVIDEFELGWRLSSQPVVAVTGTNGKSTTAALIVEALTAGTGSRPLLAGNTEFGAPLCAIAEHACVPIVAEVSSYQLEGCSEFLPEIGVLTNVTAEHLWRHGTMDGYAAVKRRLFLADDAAAPISVLNVDDATGRRLAEEVRDRGRCALTYGSSIDAAYRIADASWTLETGEVRLQTPSGPVQLCTRHPGIHNAANVAAALAVADALGLARDLTIQALERTPRVPGRMELIDLGQPFHTVVDLAHNADGVARTLTSIRAAIAGRVITVLGAVGAPEDPSRPTTGRVAREHSDVLILTTASLRGEPRMLPLSQLRSGAVAASGAMLLVEIERRRAIARAIALAQPGDAVAILGRGHLEQMATDARGSWFAFDDRAVARELLGELQSGVR
jgi:UDP-N-acetylmuramoyl-L-alanyl-D-glutamate--2,6-diaminopimelate ligase